MGEFRRSRTEKPRAPHAYRANARDARVLHAIGKRKITTTTQLVPFFPTAASCARRLAKLMSLGLVMVHAPNRAEHNRYTLTHRGRDWLVGQGFDPDELHVSQVLPPANTLVHLLGIAEFHAALMRSVQRHPAVTLEVFEADHALRRAGGARVPGYIPDAAALLTCIGGQFGVALELDTGLEATRHLVGKAKVVDALQEANAACWGMTPWLPLLVAPKGRRLASLERVISQHARHAPWLAAEWDVLKADDILMAPLMVVGADGTRSTNLQALLGDEATR